MANLSLIYLKTSFEFSVPISIDKPFKIAIESKHGVGPTAGVAWNPQPLYTENCCSANTKD
jgi:hypothetical protein